MKDLEKYLVIPKKYVVELDEKNRNNLEVIMNEIKNIRFDNNKELDPLYIVCKQSEPYAKQVWDLILRHDCTDELKTSVFDQQMKNAHLLIDAGYKSIDEQMKDALEDFDKDE